MDNPTGTIHALVVDARGTRAIVDIDVDIACPRCAAGKGCGAGIVSGSGKVRRVEATLDHELTLNEGDNVEIALASTNLLHAALLVYGMPLAGGVIFAGLAYLFALGDGAAALAAVTGLSLGLLFSRRRLRRDACIESFVPHIEKRLPSVQIGG